MKKKVIKQDIEVENAHPIKCDTDKMDSGESVLFDNLNLSLSDVVSKTDSNSTIQIKRILEFTYENGSVVPLATICKNKCAGLPTTYMISVKEGMLYQKTKEYIQATTPENIWKNLMSKKKVQRLHTGDYRLLAVVKNGLKIRYVLMDRRKDLDNYISEHSGSKYKIVSEKFGYSFSDKTKKDWTKKFPKAQWEDIESIVSDNTITVRSSYREIAKLLVGGKKNTDNLTKVEAKRLLSRVRGDRIWIE